MTAALAAVPLSVLLSYDIVTWFYCLSIFSCSTVKHSWSIKSASDRTLVLNLMQAARLLNLAQIYQPVGTRVVGG